MIGVPFVRVFQTVTCLRFALLLNLHKTVLNSHKRKRERGWGKGGGGRGRGKGEGERGLGKGGREGERERCWLSRIQCAQATKRLCCNGNEAAVASK